LSSEVEFAGFTPVFARVVPDLESLQDRTCDPGALSAGKGERLLKGRSELSRLSEFSPRAMQPSSHRFRPKSKLGRSFINAHSLDIAHDEHDAEVFGEVIDGLLKHTANFVLSGGLFGIWFCLHERKRYDSSAITLVGRIQHGQIDGRLLLAPSPKRFVYCDAREPGR
jgi:hypothetical protein